MTVQYLLTVLKKVYFIENGRNQLRNLSFFDVRIRIRVKSRIRILGVRKSRIFPDPDPQHWFLRKKRMCFHSILDIQSQNILSIQIPFPESDLDPLQYPFPQCCGSGSGIRIRKDPGFSNTEDPDPGFYPDPGFIRILTS